MTLDQYSVCSYGCIYCFADYQRSIGGASKRFKHNDVSSIHVGRTKDIFTGKRKSQFAAFLKMRRVLQWGGMSDPFCKFEKAFGVGLELMRYLKELNYPITFSTKGTWWLDDPRYVELFRDQKNWNVKISIVTLDEDKAKILERGVPSPAERIEALGKVADLNCGGATLRLRPFMIGITSPKHLDLIRKSHEAGADAISTEFFCMEDRSPLMRERIKQISRLAGFNYLGFYRKYSLRGGYMRLSRAVKRPYIEAMKQLCDEIGMRFFVSDAHFKELSAGGGCCGLNGGWNYSKGQFTQALIMCKKSGSVTWPQIAKHLGFAKGFLAHAATGCNISNATGRQRNRAKFAEHTMFDYMRWAWNNTDHPKSPYKMFDGLMKPTGLDDSGDVIYEYDATRG
jgi:DNA repair photolyase